jgi:hypothetical protein
MAALNSWPFRFRFPFMLFLIFFLSFFCVLMTYLLVNEDEWKSFGPVEGEIHVHTRWKRKARGCSYEEWHCGKGNSKYKKTWICKLLNIKCSRQLKRKSTDHGATISNCFSLCIGFVGVAFCHVVDFFALKLFCTGCDYLKLSNIFNNNAIADFYLFCH